MIATFMHIFHQDKTLQLFYNFFFEPEKCPLKAKTGKLKPFGILLSINIVISVNNLLTETTTTIQSQTACALKVQILLQK